MQLHLTLSPDQLSTLSSLSQGCHHHLEDSSSPPFPQAAAQAELREALKEALFSQDGFEEIWAKARNRSQTLFLYHSDTAIRNLPWQLATEDRPLLSLVKTGGKTLEEYAPRVGYPLKVLVMVSTPNGVTRLAYEQEELNMLRAFSPLMAKGLVQVHFTDDGSLEDLQEKLEENQYHILHFSGHGVYRDGKGYLALEDRDTGNLDEVSAEKFNGLLGKVARKGHRPELVVLSACQTAQGVANGDISGVADTLLDGGVPAVVAMSASILDSCATFFAHHFYAELSGGYPLAAAFQEARLAVRKFEVANYPLADQGLAPGQWLIPQLLVTTKVEELIAKDSKKKELDFAHDAEIVSGERALLELRVRPKGYLFIGRRRQRREALVPVRKGGIVLLRGQGGVGKTALAENLAIRLLAAGC